jgi:hypothetical protein
MGVKPPFLFSLGRHSKQTGDERNAVYGQLLYSGS